MFLEFLSSGCRMDGMVSTLDTQQLDVLFNGTFSCLFNIWTYFDIIWWLLITSYYKL